MTVEDTDKALERIDELKSELSRLATEHHDSSVTDNNFRSGPLPILQSVLQDLSSLFHGVSSSQENVPDNDESTRNERSHSLEYFLPEGNKQSCLDLDKAIFDSQQKHDKAQKADTIIQYEYHRIQSIHQHYKKQSEDVITLNNDVVGPEIEKLNCRLQVLKEESDACCKEVDKLKTLSAELKIHLDQVKQSHHEVSEALHEVEKEEPSCARKSHDIKQEIQDLQSHISDVKHNLAQVKEEVARRRSQILSENSRCKEIDTKVNNLKRELDSHRLQKKKHEADTSRVTKDLASKKAKYHLFATDRLSIELRLRDVNEKFRHETTSETLIRKELDKMKRLLIKKQLMKDRGEQLILQLTQKYNDISLAIENLNNEDNTYKSAISDAKELLYVTTTKLVHQENIEERVKKDLKNMNDTLREKEYEIERWRLKETNLRKVITLLNIRRDNLARRATQTLRENKEATEMLRLKSLLALDLNKSISERMHKVKEFSTLCETLKRDKDEIDGATAVCRTALMEMNKKLSSFKTDLQSLQIERDSKKATLDKQKDAHDAVKSNRATLRVERTKKKGELKLKREDINRQEVKTEKMKSTLTNLVRTIIDSKSRNDRLANTKRLMVEQLDDKKKEIHKLLMRANVFEQTLKRGALALQQRKEDIRALTLQRQDIERHNFVCKSAKLTTKEFEEQLQKLQKDLCNEKKVSKKLSQELEDPLQYKKWRELGGNDLDNEQLEAKLSILIQRLSENKEQLLERDMVIKDITIEIDLLRKEVNMANMKAQPIMKKLNDYKGRVRDITRSMMALVSELSMYQATALKLEEEKEELEEIRKRNQEQYEEKKLQTDADGFIESQQKTNRKEKLRSNCERFQSEEKNGKIYYPANYALRTTAEPRPTAYIPDSGLEIPKPYGSMAPFKPTSYPYSRIRSF